MDGKALTGGTWATELHGGSDVGATTTTARHEGDHVRLNGLKWFTSNANGGLAVATARPDGAPEGSSGLGLYLVPTHLDDGTPNAMRLRRLKDKLGTVGVPTGEIDLEDTWAVELAPPPLGFKLMMEALEFSRIQNAMASVGLQRRAFLEAISYCSHREAFGNVITRYPMLQDEILKIMVQQEAGMALVFETAQAFQEAHKSTLDDVDNRARTWMRVSTALAKYQTAERAIDACRAAIEIIGGNAYTYDYCTPRLLRDAQVLTVWEGPANIQALELLRLLGNRYAGFEAFEGRVTGVLEGASGKLGGALSVIREALDECREAAAFIMSDAAEAQRHARKLLALMADIMAATLLAEEADAELKDGNARKALVLRLFTEQALAPPARHGIGPGRDWMHRHFDALVGYDVIDPAVLDAA
jgi:alkylation response protein AidB-like acyl-CoA dehydrogenase